MSPSGLDRNVSEVCDFFEGFSGNQQVQNLSFRRGELTRAGSKLARRSQSSLFRGAGKGLPDVFQEDAVVDRFFRLIRRRTRPSGRLPFAVHS